MGFLPHPRPLPVALCIVVQFSHLVLLVITSQAQPPIIPAVFAFGDSIIDPGNNNNLTVSLAKANHPPYGIDFINHQPTGRFCNGKIPTDFLVSKLGIQEVLPAYLSPELKPEELLTGVSFASSTSGYDPLTPKILISYSMEEQLEMFKEYKEKLRAIAGEERAASIIANSIYFICAGSNDVANNYFLTHVRKAEYDIPSYADLLLNLASTFVEELINLGARKIGITGIPPIGCVPAQRTLHGGILRDCDLDQNQMARLFNSKLPMELQRMTTKYDGTTLIYIDCYSILLDIIQNPNSYGFEVSTQGCCGTGELEASYLCNKVTSEVCPDTSKYVFWDSFHPTERTYQFIVEIIYDQFSSILHPN